MRRTLSRSIPFKFIGKEELYKLKMKAIRAGIWYRALSRIDRVLFDLTIKVAHRVRSPLLASRILAVAGKLKGLLEGKVARIMREIGFSLSYKLSSIAQKWGNESAKNWANDESFATYLAVIKLNR